MQFVKTVQLQGDSDKYLMSGLIEYLSESP